MKRSLLTTIALLTVTPLVLVGCGKSAPTASSATRLAAATARATAPAAMAQGQTPAANNGLLTGSAASSGNASLQLSSLRADHLGTLDVTITGPGLAQPIGKRLTAAELGNSNTLAFEHLPAGSLTATLTATADSGQIMGTQDTVLSVTPNGNSKLVLKLTIANGSFAFQPVDTLAATPVTPAAGDDPAPTSGGAPGMLVVEISNKAVQRKYLVLKRLAVTVKVTNHNATETLDGEVKVEFHKMKGLIMKEDAVVETLTAPVEGLAPGKSMDVTLTSTVSADDAEATVHTVVGSSSASTFE